RSFVGRGAEQSGPRPGGAGARARGRGRVPTRARPQPGIPPGSPQPRPGRASASLTSPPRDVSAITPSARPGGRYALPGPGCLATRRPLSNGPREESLRLRPCAEDTGPGSAHPPPGRADSLSLGDVGEGLEDSGARYVVDDAEGADLRREDEGHAPVLGFLV